MVRRSRLRLIAAGALAIWIGRWALLELAAHVGRLWLPRGPAPKDSARPPGRLPGPFDR